MRRKTLSVKIGKVFIGSDHSIKTQSMTTASTMDTDKSVDEAIRIIQAGGKLVRFTAPNINEAKNLLNIKNALVAKGYDDPLVADIHFTPNAALEASKIVEKVRINPGNYVDKKKFEVKEYDDKSYQDELLKIEEKFIPLINSCKENKVAMRIGTNHGSLSDRVMNRFGDTPLGMVESAMEFLRICKQNDFDQIVLSMKSSNPIVMIHAYRLLVKSMENENMHYPLHLGVTEAGDGLDGRIKSALGIGTLLTEGLGDTVRVSLTEDPEFEIPVAEKILEKIDSISKKIRLKNTDKRAFSFFKRETESIKNIGEKNPPIVISNSSNDFEGNFPDYLFIDNLDNLDESKQYIIEGKDWNKNLAKNIFPYFNSLKDFRKSKAVSNTLNFIEIELSKITNTIMQTFSNSVVIVLNVDNTNRHDLLSAFNFLEEKQIKIPVILKGSYQSLDFEKVAIDASIEIGSILLEGMGNGIWIQAKDFDSKINELSFLILQNTRTRIFKTDYISCPSCGRTKFDLRETTALVKEHTNHLKGLKISVMGCIVNGPGEMADADYGYVGSGDGVISLYKGKELVKRNISSEQAVNELIQLIKENDDWVDPKN
ncbi:MAG: (E)-4-hydroxy-3-methylbut-2-enyl-diphosphate synthase [Candidatus Marinimicrobia bacterium]|nr:(E)-4-hydroxy-3-methylbut-2-enyl-diphosphate synthase [Candidatus Neomarinimicrobiota bacterium]